MEQCKFQVIFQIRFIIIATMIPQGTSFSINLFEMESFDRYVLSVGGVEFKALFCRKIQYKSLADQFYTN